MRKQFNIPFEELISVENLLEAWQEFLNGKRSRIDVREFSFNLMDNILTLHNDLANKTYTHGGYEAFRICDPKSRDIHKATVRDRLLHHAIHRKLYPFFSNVFIADSFSCQLDKGTHRAIRRFEIFARKASKNNTRTCWVLKCDIRKFFANVDHSIIKNILSSHIADQDTLWILENIIASFQTQPKVGLPLGNLTSQLFVNIYMNEFDKFVKHVLHSKFYIRYCDDFVFLSENKQELVSLITKIEHFLRDKLKLELHPNKVLLRTLESGVDFLGWINFPNHRIPRTSTKRKMLKRIKASPTLRTLNSYLGLLKHGSTKLLKREVLKQYHLYQ